MKKLFMIRLENGNSVIAQAENEREALAFAGLDADLESVANDLKVDVPTTHWELVRCGLGPQNVTVRELNNLAVDVVLTNEGELEFRFGNCEEAEGEIFEDYPALVSVLDEIARQEDPRVTTELAKKNSCVPWHTSETERAGCREGVRLAALQFLFQYREAMQNLRLNRPV